MQTVIFLVCLATYGTLAETILPVPTENNLNEYRLPGNIKPSRYEIYIDVSKTLQSAKAPWEFDGRVNITAKTKKDIEYIVLHINNMTISKIYINNIELNNNGTFDKKHQLLNITYPIKKEQQFTLNIIYKGYLQDNMYGFYISSYENEKKNEYVATTQFQPTHARTAFPCFDEPEYKAIFSVKIKRPVEYKTLSNMQALNAAPGDSNTDAFEDTPIMSTYLLAFVVSKFTATSAKNNKYKIWARPTAEAQTKFAADIVENITEVMKNFTGIDYFTDMKMPKMDMVALPDFAAGAMENWGLLTYRETALLVDDKVSTQRNIQRVASVIAHEVAHQWFGDYVTTKWWDNTWLNEGFATYFEYHATGKVYPNWAMEEQFLIDEQQSVFGVDALENTTPLNYSVSSPTEISSHFGSISYNKGGSVIRMMEHFLGNKNFKKGLNTYLNKNKLSSTVPDDLFKGFENMAIIALNEEIKLPAVMKNWVYNPGYPVITVSQNKKTITIQQERFLLYSKKNKTEGKWYVPISYTTSSHISFTNTEPKLWLNDAEEQKNFDIEKEEDWIIVNIQGTGYYRVNYDKTLWAKITKVLKSEKRNNIHRLNRAQLIDDAMNLARAGKIKYDVALDVLDYLTEETDYYPWYSAFEAFRFLLQRFADDSATGKDIRNHILSLIDASIKDNNFMKNTDKMNVTDVYNYVNALQWACDLGDENCVKNAKNLFHNSSISIDKNVKSIVYCTAIKNGNETDWENLWTKYTKSNVNAEQVTILSALGCSNNETILNSYLKKSINSDIRKQDTAYVFSAVYTGSSKGVDIALKFLETNYKNIAASYGGMNALGNAIRGLADRLNTKEQLTDFGNFLKTNKDELKDVAEIADAAMEKANTNIKWADTYSKDITEYLKKKKSGSSVVMGSTVLCVTLVTFVTYSTLW